MLKFKVTVLGCDNGSGIFERGGDLEFNQVEVANTLELGPAIAVAAGCVRREIAEINVAICGDHRIVSFVDSGAGQSFAFVATEVQS